ncbi:MAG: DHH family phosphoesterase [DPANN group archaeon]|nr:DHH family phosphoesterase [DPANN group archaeon]
MSVPKKFYADIRKELDSCTNPLFLYDDDPDGFCSFLLLYRYIQEGKGMVVKTSPTLGELFVRKVEEYGPDKLFILDKPLVDERFFEKMHTPTVWIDHHGLQETRGIRYFNPRRYHALDQCTTSICYHAVQREEDLWIAGVGAISDWTFPDFMKEVQAKYPKLISKRVKKPETALFTTRLGELARIFSFLLKGSIKDVYSCAKIITRIKDPEEILQQTSSRGRFIHKRFERLYRPYQELLDMAEKEDTKDRLLVFTYTADRHSLTNDLANEMIYKHPKKFVIIGREKSGEVKMSLRCPWTDIPPALEQALKGVNGYGGGHAHACGACVEKEDFPRFVENLRTGLKKRQG